MDYIKRLEKVIEERREQDIKIDDITCLYSDFMNKRVDKFNHLYKVRILPFLKRQFKKRCNKDNFNKKLFSKILFNNLYYIRQDKNDAVPYGVKRDSEIYNDFASHQYIRRELEHLSIDDIILLSWELVKRFKNK